MSDKVKGPQRPFTGMDEGAVLPTSMLKIPMPVVKPPRPDTQPKAPKK